MKLILLRTLGLLTLISEKIVAMVALQSWALDIFVMLLISDCIYKWAITLESLLLQSFAIVCSNGLQMT